MRMSTGWIQWSLGSCIAFAICIQWANGNEARDREPVKSMVSAVSEPEEITRAIKGTGAKIVFVSAWSSSCPFCLEEMPAIAAAYKELKDTVGVSFVGISLDGLTLRGKISEEAKSRALSATRTTVERKGLSFTNLVWCGAADPIVEKFGIETTPFNAVYSGEGKLLAELPQLPEDSIDAARVIKRSILEEFDKQKK
ncbi:MAG: TlpA family protein disulfide reductase [Planctomycetota bacterium]|nr:TlpA family protein disulfide reductase [Planctomycetota bacterium]